MPKPIPILTLALVALAGVVAAPGAAAPITRDHPSPYLALHGEDPVGWQEWDLDSLARARREGKLLFVSSGYFACHWCHVMQRESYRDPEIAARLNRLAVPVKVDRELQPALDTYLIDFVERTRGQAGWPLNVFLTPDGYPLVGLTYLPPDRFALFLERLGERWATDRDALRAAARESALARLQRDRAEPPALGPGQGDARLRAFAKAALDMADELSGGFGTVAKFPMVPQLRLLLELPAGISGWDTEAFLRLTLDAMATGGLRDHLGGGFFRYVVEPHWREPHFEKMLYDNALLAGLYLDAGERLAEPRYTRVALDTLDFMLREMATPQGTFIASLSALDDQDVEGGYYLWSAEDLARVLSEPQRRLAERLWRLAGEPPFAAGHLPLGGVTLEAVAADLGLTPAAARALAAAARQRLLEARAQRGLPRDTKELAAWNGLALSALARAAAAGHGRYREAAATLAERLATEFWDGRTVHRARHRGAPLGDPSLGDFAYLARGLADWARAGGAVTHRDTAAAVVRAAWARHYRDGAWHLGGPAVIPGIPGETALADGPLPAPSAVLIGLTLDLVGRLADGDLPARARNLANADPAPVAAQPFAYPGHLSLLPRNH